MEELRSPLLPRSAYPKFETEVSVRPVVVKSTVADWVVGGGTENMSQIFELVL